MGWSDTLKKQIVAMFQGSKESRVLDLARGFDNPFKIGMMPELMSYGNDPLTDYLRTEHDLLGRLLEYEAMDEYPEISNALDIVAADATQPDTPTNKRVWADSPDRDLKILLNDFLHRTLRIEDNIWPIARSLCAKGNTYGELVVAPDGVLDIRILPVSTMRRVEGPKGELYGYIQDFKRRIGYMPQDWMRLMNEWQRQPQMGIGGSPYSVLGTEEAIPFEPWQICHWKLPNKECTSVYGYPYTEAARWPWRRLVMMEDSALVYRLQRAPERYAFYVNVGNRNPQEAMRLVNMVRQQFKKTKIINRETNQIDLRFDVLSPSEDFFIPSFNGQDSTRVEVLGAPAWQSTEDVVYFRDKLTASLQIPKAYQGYDEGATKAVLSSEDVRFARSVMRVQQELRLGLIRVCEVHLASLGIPPSRVEFDIFMTVPSAIFELAQMEVRSARAGLALQCKEFMSQRWILKTIYGMNDQEVQEVIDERGDDFKRDATIQAQAASAAAEFAPEEEAAGESRVPGRKQGLLQEKSLGAKKLMEGLAELDRKTAARMKDQTQNVARYMRDHSKQIREIRSLLSTIRGARTPLRPPPTNP